MILESKTIRLRLLEESDAEFILELSLDEKYNQFLSSVSPDLQSQRDWIRTYKNDEKIKKQGGVLKSMLASDITIVNIEEYQIEYFKVIVELF